MFGIVSQSGNTPTMYNPIICFDTSDTSASNITESSNLVSLLKDRSGNGNDGVQGTGSKQPSTNTNTINSLNAIYCGVGDYLSMASVSTAVNLTLICVFKPLGNNHATASFFCADAADNDFQIDSLTSGQFHGRVNSTNLGATSAPDLGSNEINNVILVVYRFSDNDSDVTVRLNGAEVDSDTYDGAMNSTMTMRIAINRGLSRSLKLDLGEFLVFNEDLSATQIATIETYLTDKWGVV
jgi:hypothetical protein